MAAKERPPFGMNHVTVVPENFESVPDADEAVPDAAETDEADEDAREDRNLPVSESGDGSRR